MEDDHDCQDESQWSDGSSADMAIVEERLYSLVYHSSDTFDLPDNGSTGQSNGSKSHEVTEFNQPLVNHSEHHPGFRSKVSRLDNVKHIIDYADRKRDYDKLNHLHNTGYHQKDQSKSLYFESLSKELSSIPRQADLMSRKRVWLQNPLHNQHHISEVNINVPTTARPNHLGLLPNVLNTGTSNGCMRGSPNSFKRNLPRSSGVGKETDQRVTSFSFDLSTHSIANSSINTPGNIFSPPNATRSHTKETNNHVFRLDDRLFVSKPLNMNEEKDLNIERINKRRKNKLRRLVRKQKRLLLLNSSTTDDVEAVAVIKPNELLNKIVVNDVVIVDDDDNMQTKYDTVLKPKNTGTSKDQLCEVIVVDSDGDGSILLSDSDESVRLVPVPIPPIPIIIAVEDSSEEEPLRKRMVPKEIKQPELDPDHIDSSFDFLDNTYDMDGLAQSQARLLSNLISNHGSKESLLDEHLFEHSHSSPIAVVIAVASCSGAAPNSNFPNQDNNISSSTSTSSRLTVEQSVATTSSKPPTNSNNSEEDAGTFKTPPKQGKKRKLLNSKTPLKKVAKDDDTVVIELQSEEELNKNTSARSETKPGTDKESRMLDYINSRIASRKTNLPHEFKIPQSNEHIVVAKPAAVVGLVLEDVEIVEVRVKEKTTDSSSQPVSGKKRRREERRKEREEVEIISEDVVAVHSGSKSRVSIEEIIGANAGGGEEAVLGNRKRERMMGEIGMEDGIVTVLKKSKKKGKRSRERARERLERYKRTRVNNEVITYTEILGEEYVAMAMPRSPRTWTREMRHFYNNSWGGENMDVQKIQQLMPGNPLMWRLSNGDLYPTYGRKRRHDIKCHNCKQMGHMSYQCNNAKTLTCVMCGNLGHSKERCPNSLCLQCGQPGRNFSKDCGQCHASVHNACPRCTYLHDPSQPCRDTTSRGVAPKRSHTVSPRYRPYNQGAGVSNQGGNHQNNKYNPFFQNRRSSRW